jgi:2-dehydropantoate 2-reductase
VVAASIRIESERIETGRIVQTSPGVRIELAADDPGTAAQLPALAELLERAGITTVIGSSEKQVLWSKLVRLNALSASTSAFEQPIGAIRGDPTQRAALIGCIEEGAAVANADGAVIDPGATLAELDGAHASLRSSMQKDLAAGRAPELDAVQGAVLRAAARLGIPCPTIGELTERIARRAGIRSPA